MIIPMNQILKIFFKFKQRKFNLNKTILNLINH